MNFLRLRVDQHAGEFDYSERLADVMLDSLKKYIPILF